MPRRNFYYYLLLIWREYLIAAPALLLETLAHRSCPYQIITNIRVADPIPETRGYFIGTIEQALALIDSADSVRFRRVQQEIHSVFSAPAVWGSSYGRALKICFVDLRCFYVEGDLNTFVRLVASALICEATAGHLIGKGILRTKRNQPRFDQLCKKEAQRFLRKFGMTNTLWDTDACQMAFRKRATKILHGLFKRDHAAEATVWRKSGIPYKSEKSENS